MGFLRHEATDGAPLQDGAPLRVCRALALFLVLALAVPAAADDQAILLDLAGPPADAIHHPIETFVPEAQNLFDQGLALVWAFNHEAAIQAFEAAARADPHSPMPYWGIAYALGPNINMPADPHMLMLAIAALGEAKARAGNGSERERDYLAALETRYGEDPAAERAPLDLAYAEAMAALAAKYPEDLDARVLHAEAVLDLRPWRWWEPDGKPAPGTEAAIAALRAVLESAPDHIGANHLLIHALEASPDPARAKAAAERLAARAGHAGHLLHMPAHIQANTGDFAACSASNEAAIAADEAYLAASRAAGLYATMYAAHNMHFLAFCDQMAGRKAATFAAAGKLAAHIAAHQGDIPELASLVIDYFGMQPALMAVRFQDWDRVLALKAPPAGAMVAAAFWHYARGVAYIGKRTLPYAEEERAALAALVPAIPETVTYGPNNSGRAMAALALAELDGRLALATGRFDKAIALLEGAVAQQDALSYDDPPAWYHPVRETLGAALLIAGRAKEAARVFRADLERHPGNGRSLWGLWQSLEASGRSKAADETRAEYEKAWRAADIRLKLGDY